MSIDRAMNPNIVQARGAANLVTLVVDAHSRRSAHTDKLIDMHRRVNVIALCIEADHHVVFTYIDGIAGELTA